MTTERLHAEMMYHASLSPFKKMLSDGIITAEDYAKVDTILHNRYRPIFVDNIAQIQVDITPDQR